MNVLVPGTNVFDCKKLYANLIINSVYLKSFALRVHEAR